MPSSPSVRRPLLLRLLPPGLRPSLYYRHYHKRHRQWRTLFERAPLAFAPGVAMHDLVVGDVISGNIAFTGFYELALTRELCRLARAGGRFVDVGANMGYFSLLWAALNPANQVSAYEPSPRNAVILSRNVERNGFASQITAVAKAAGDRRDTIGFAIGPDEQTGWGGMATASRKASIEVPMVRLDDEMGDRPIAVLKVDVEGADALVLRGCQRLLAGKRIGRIFFEQNPSRMQELGIGEDDARAFLESHGYECRQFSADAGEWVAYPKPG